MSAQSVFTVADGLFLPSSLASGPWDSQALHGGAPAALIVSELERALEGLGLSIGKLSFELLRPVPVAPLGLRLQTLRPGRRVRELGAQLRHGDELVCRASALALQPVAETMLTHAVTDLREHPPARPLPPPDSSEAKQVSIEGSPRANFAATIEMRWLTPPWSTGPAQVWMRMTTPLLPKLRASPLSRLAAAADFGNGVAAELRFDRFIFINADLTIHLWRPPQGEWIGLDARTLLLSGGAGIAESVLHDLEGPVGRAFQTLVVQPR